MRRLITALLAGLRHTGRLVARCWLTARYMRRLHYSRHLAWHKAAR